MVGKIFFLLVRIKIKYMEIVIIRRESTGSGPNTYSESENIAKFEIMDGAPVRGRKCAAFCVCTVFCVCANFLYLCMKIIIEYSV